ncbi:glycosyltransferase [Thioflavicoccus mobilis 8321]|uniref:Glycosyltransferase n=2 Tax=Thioflavicoccus mobilis TaxID=80679 RepID=L0H282_9GAMM|nr:glycosyltransferase [Thioflavicoccus mobilis 8321]
MKSRPRIALIAHGVNSNKLSGAGRSALALISQLLDCYEFFVYAPRRDGFTAVVSDLGVAIRTIPYRNSFHVPSRRALSNRARQLRFSLSSRRAARNLCRAMAADGINLVHTNSLVSDIGALSAHALSLPHVWHIRELPASQLGEPVNGWAHVGRSLARASRLICVSKAVMSFAKQLICNAETPVCRIYNGVFDEAAPPPFFESRYSGGSASLCMIGGIHPSKGQQIAIGALRDMLDKGIEASLSFVGSGDVDWLSGLIDTHGVKSHVSVLGRVENPFDCLRGFDISLVCSENEAMGRVTAESLVLGIPIVATQGGATNELLRGGAWGYLAERNPQDLAHAIIETISNYDSRVERARAVALRARRTFSNQSYAQAVDQVYRKTLRAV